MITLLNKWFAVLVLFEGLFLSQLLNKFILITLLNKWLCDVGPFRRVTFVSTLKKKTSLMATIKFSGNGLDTNKMIQMSKIY